MSSIINLETCTYEGLLIATDWDESLNIIALSLLKSNEQEIPIHMNLETKTLTHFCKERMQIKGNIKSGFLYVKNFKKIKISLGKMVAECS